MLHGPVPLTILDFKSSLNTYVIAVADSFWELGMGNWEIQFWILDFRLKSNPKSQI
jgi:hypothetical protein